MLQEEGGVDEGVSELWDPWASRTTGHDSSPGILA